MVFGCISTCTLNYPTLNHYASFNILDLLGINRSHGNQIKSPLGGTVALRATGIINSRWVSLSLSLSLSLLDILK